MKYFGPKAWKTIVGTVAAGLASGVTVRAAAGDEFANATGLSLRDAVRRVVDYNETIQIRALEVAVAKHRIAAEHGIFEPELVLSDEHVESHRPNTEEEKRNLGLTSLLANGRTVFDERNNNYSVGIEFLTPTGGKFRVGSSLRDLSNNLNLGTNEYVSTVGISLDQPLLKGAGKVATMANIRIAAISSDLAFQDYRKKLMEIVAQAEAAYWDLYLAQEQLRLSTESMKLADTVFKDNTEKEKAGRSSALEVLEAHAGLQLRQSRQSDASQKVLEAMNRLFAFYSSAVVETQTPIKAIDTPVVLEAPVSFFESWRRTFESNPDYLSRRQQAALEGVRVAYAKNQRLPQLDLKASYGLNGLGSTVESSFNDVGRVGYQAWTISGEMRIPLGGGIRSKHELAAAQIKEKEALLGIHDVEVQLSSGLATAIGKLKSSKDSVEGYKTAVDFTEQVLKSQQARLNAGNTDTRTVLETEQKVFESRLSVLDSLVQHERAKLEWENLEGSILNRWNLEISKQDLDQKARGLAQGGHLTDAQYQNFLRQIRESYDHNAGFARQTDGTPTHLMTPEEAEKQRQILRDYLKESK